MKNKLTKNIISLFKLASIISIPLFGLILLGFFVIPESLIYIKEVIGFGFLTLIVFSITVIFSSNKVRQFLSLIFLTLLSFLVFVKLSFYHNYGVKISASALFVIFETDTTESSDFLSNYFDGFVFGLAILFTIILPVFAKWLLVKTNISGRFRYISVLAISTVVASSYAINKRFDAENIVVTSITSYSEFISLRKDLKTDLAKPVSNYVNVAKIDTTAQTHVVIIGEATSNWHMQLYGYNRPTNPKLSKIREQLIVFDSVISPHVHTVMSLDKILTLSDMHAPNKKNNTSIVQLANAAGYDTYWISNQRPVGLHERISSIIANAAKEKYFVATDNSDDIIYDEALLPILDKVLKKPSKQKIIFLHLIGTHGRYSSRFPESYNYFKDNSLNTKFKQEQAFKLINEYDNAIRYNDNIVNSVIDKVRQQNTNSFVLYFSDHGDELFDTIDFIGHNEYQATRPMYEVPFIAWLSDEYKLNFNQTKRYNNFTKRAYNLEDFIYSFADLAKINFKQMDSTKSVFSDRFFRKPRLIRDNEDYDLRLKTLEN